MRWMLGALLAATSQEPAAWAEPQDVAFVSEADGTEQRYVELLPAGFDPARERPLLIALHGHGSDRWQYVRQNRAECAAARDVALRRGMIFVSPDYRAPDSWMGPKAEADLLQVIAEVRRRRKVGKLYVVGASMGGTSALIFTSLHPELVAGVCAQNAAANMVEFAGFPDSIARSYGGSKAEKPEEYRKRSPELQAARFRQPVALTAGGKDAVVPPGSVGRLADALKARGSPVLLLHRPEGGHETNREDSLRALDFLFGDR